MKTLRQREHIILDPFWIHEGCALTLHVAHTLNDFAIALSVHDKMLVHEAFTSGSPVSWDSFSIFLG